jgi:AraC-like DNA-binding protein
MHPLLDDLFENLRLSGSIVCGVTAAAPWGVAFEEVGGFSYHLVVEGEALLAWDRSGPDADAGEERQLRPGSLAMITPGLPHTIRSDKQARCEPLADISQRTLPSSARWKAYKGGEGPTSLTLCGVFRMDQVVAPLMVAALPSVVVLEKGALPHSMQGLVDLVLAEARADRPGAPALVQRYAELMFLEALRAVAMNDADLAGLFAGLRHERIARALSAFHSAPGAAWSVERLAECAGMSRSAFKRAFPALVGIAPHDYVARWRLAHAARRLKESRSSIAQVAAEVGFQSDASFSKAFRGAYGLPPAAFRRAGRY